MRPQSKPNQEPRPRGSFSFGRAVTVYLFVYGTLRRAYPNHRLLAGAEFMGSAQTAQAYPLVVHPQRAVPYLLDLPGQGMAIRGEIYSMDRALLATLDLLEGVPHHYLRKALELSDSTHPVQAYFKAEIEPALLSLPMLPEFGLQHAACYVPPSLDLLTGIGDPSSKTARTGEASASANLSGKATKK